MVIYARPSILYLLIQNKGFLPQGGFLPHVTLILAINIGDSAFFDIAALVRQFGGLRHHQQTESIHYFGPPQTKILATPLRATYDRWRFDSGAMQTRCTLCSLNTGSNHSKICLWYCHLLVEVFQIPLPFSFSFSSLLWCI